MDVSNVYTKSYSTNSSIENLSSFRAASETIYIIWDLAYGLIAVPTILGNILILLCLSKFRENKTSLHILVGNLAVSDLIMGFLLPYCIILDTLNLNSEKYFCLVKCSFIVFAIGISSYGLLLVSIDRFSAVCFPFKHHKTLSTNKIVVMLTIGWTYVAIFAFLPLSGWNFYDINTPYTCTQDEVLTPIYSKVMNGNFILFLGINLTLYIIVMRISLKKARKVHSEQNVFDYKASTKELYRIKTMAMVQGLFAFCWFPYVLISIAITFSDNPVLKKSQYWSVIPGLLNSSINWIVYGYRNKQLRREFKRHFTWVIRF